MTASVARAQTLGKEGDLSVAAERLSGLTAGSLGIDLEGPIGEVETDYVSVRLLASDGAGAGPFGALFPVFTTPRIGIDYFLADRFSLGGSLGLMSTSWEEEDGDELSATTFLLAVRAGYWLELNDTLGFWPRGGLTFVSASQTNEDADDEVSTTLPALSLEAPLMIALGPAFLQVAATLDASVGGSGETTNDGDTTAEFDVTVLELGLQAGLGIVF